MKRMFGLSAVMVAFAAIALATSAQATGTCVSPTFISFNTDTVFAFETNYNNATYISAPGSILTVMGKVVCFVAPFAGLNNNGKEYSVVIQNLVSQGTVHTVPIGDQWDTDYDVTTPATFAIYEDTTPDLPGPTTIGSPLA